MKGTNPIIPPGMNFEGAKRGRSNMRMAVIVVVLLHIALFTGILFNACKQKDEEAGEGAHNTTAVEMAQITAPQPQPPPLPQPSLPTEPELPDISVLPPLPPNAGATIPPPPTSAFPSSQPGLLAPPLAQAPIASAGAEHVIASGESFWTIGKKYGVSAKSIEGANPNVIPTRMKIGQKIIIPPKPIAEPTPAPAVVDDGSTYVVKSGDTLGHIALRHGVKVNELKAANPNIIPTRMKIGQQLKMPTGATASPQTVTPSLPAFPGSGTTASPPVDPVTGLPFQPTLNR